MRKLDSALSTDRRAFLGGSATVATALSLPGLAIAQSAPSTRAWSIAMAKYDAAEQAADAFDRDVFEPAYQLEKRGIGYDIPDAVHDEYERLADILSNADTELMATPAPHRAALRWKLDRIIQPDGKSTPCWSMDYIRQAIADYRHLLGDA